MKTIVALAIAAAAGCAAQQPAPPPAQPAPRRASVALITGHVTDKSQRPENGAWQIQMKTSNLGATDMPVTAAFTDDVCAGRLDATGLAILGPAKLANLATNRPQDVSVGDRIEVLVPLSADHELLRDGQGRLVSVGLRIVTNQQRE